MANGLAVDGGFRFFAFSNQGSDIRSFFSTDGMTWTGESGIRLALDSSAGLESVRVKDPGVIRLPDGSYFMVYTTVNP